MAQAKATPESLYLIQGLNEIYPIQEYAPIKYSRAPKVQSHFPRTQYTDKQRQYEHYLLSYRRYDCRRDKTTNSSKIVKKTFIRTLTKPASMVLSHIGINKIIIWEPMEVLKEYYTSPITPTIISPLLTFFYPFDQVFPSLRNARVLFFLCPSLSNLNPFSTVECQL